MKLGGGRILGPLDIERVRLLVAKGKINGSEMARHYPEGDWQDINSIPEIADLFLDRAVSIVKNGEHEKADLEAAAAAPTRLMTGSVQPGVELETQQGDLDKTEVLTTATSDEDRTAVSQGPIPLDKAVEDASAVTLEKHVPAASTDLVLNRGLSAEKTVLFQHSRVSDLAARKSSKTKQIFITGFLAFSLGYFGYEILLQDDSKRTVTPIGETIRARIPAMSRENSDPARSAKFYEEGLKFYVQDHVSGYAQASENFGKSASLDPDNVKALAMLASSYLNLIDSLNKDENYFAVVTKLIEMAKAKGVDLPEIVIAEVEFFITMNRPEAAQDRIVEYTKVNPNFGSELFYYLALSFYHRGDYSNAARYLNQFPENKAFSANLFLLKGMIAEALGETQAALGHYAKAIDFNKNHMKSRLRVADIHNSQGRLKDSAQNLKFAAERLHLLSPTDRARMLYLHGLLAELYQKWDIALADMERAAKLDKGKSEYLLELYILRGKAGDDPKNVAKPVRMYYFLGEGERLFREGNTHDALTKYLEARQANPESPIPLVKIGDMFRSMSDLANARLNYRLAAERASQNIEIWSKYIDVLIESYDWDEAQKAMDKFRKLAVNQSAIDKAAADMYAKQGLHSQAQAYYRKAMSREAIDTDVYVAFAKSLLATKNYKEAPFFFAIALRYDPLNYEAVIGTAKAVAALDSVDRAISMLQDELKKRSAPKAELLAAIAELQIQQGEWEQAQRFVNQASVANPDYAYTWKLQGQIHLNNEGSDKKALDRALDAFKSYSDRNPSDPSGYLERYQLFIKKTQFDKALDELNKIYTIYPKYPKLHFYRGTLYSLMGNRKAAIDEFRVEVTNHPGDAVTLVSLGKEFLLVNAPAEALDAFNKAMGAAPNWSEPKHQAAYANHLLKNYPAAVALFNAALALDQANPLIHKRMGFTFREMGDRPAMARAFRKYIEMEPDAPDRAQFEKYR